MHPNACTCSGASAGFIHRGLSEGVASFTSYSVHPSHPPIQIINRCSDLSSNKWSALDTFWGNSILALQQSFRVVVWGSLHPEDSWPKASTHWQGKVLGEPGSVPWHWFSSSPEHGPELVRPSSSGRAQDLDHGISWQSRRRRHAFSSSSEPLVFRVFRLGGLRAGHPSPHRRPWDTARTQPTLARSIGPRHSLTRQLATLVRSRGD